jgi:hypothetical protein
MSGTEYKSLDKILDLIYNYVTFLNKTTMTVTTEDGGRQNMYAKEPQIEVMDQDYAKEAELANGRWAMIGWVAAIGAYVTTGQIIPGIF